jgi:hypothetical protein
MHLYTYDHFSVDRLTADLTRATEGWDWSKGAYGHSLSLPSREETHPEGQDHYNNLPFANVLGNCPYFREIFDGFECEKVSFRLLRRPPMSSYAWHTDKDKGPSVVRFQVPIITNDESALIVTDYHEYSEFKSMKERLSERDAFERYALFKESNQGFFEEHVLQPGVLYYFDTNRFHNLFNLTSTERITLVMDFFVNDWLRQRYPAIEEECGSIIDW